MIKALAFDLGNTILDEEAGREIDIRLRPAIPMPGVLEVLPTIKLPMGIWANTAATATEVRQWLNRAVLDHYFTWIVTSFDVGHRKPDPKFFEWALKECGCNTNEVLFIGNQLNSDIKGANGCGIRSVLLTGSAYRSHDDTGEPTAKPTYRIAHFCELPELLEKVCFASPASD